MNKRFLDLLYKKRGEALSAQMGLSTQKDFSANDCSREVHNAEMTGITNQIKVIDEIIECYIGT